MEYNVRMNGNATGSMAPIVWFVWFGVAAGCASASGPGTASTGTAATDTFATLPATKPDAQGAQPSAAQAAALEPSHAALASHAPISPCAPATLNLGAARPIPVKRGVMGCQPPFSHYTKLGASGNELEDAAFRFTQQYGQQRIVSIRSEADLQKNFGCQQPGQHGIAFKAEQIVLLSVVSASSEAEELVFAVDDGQTIHLGLKTTQACQGTASFARVSPYVFVLPDPDHRVVIHRCEREPVQCGRIP